MSDFQARLEEILATYERAREGPFGKGSPVWESFVGAENALWTLDPVTHRSTVTTSWSVGRGSWAVVPWIALLDSRETRSTTTGTYVAYLFRADMSAVALCVTQGITAPSAGGPTRRARLDVVVADIRGRFGDELTADGFVIDAPLELRSAAARPRGYERGTAAFKLYERGQVPADDVLEQDLEAALAVVDRYIGADSQRPQQHRPRQSAAPARPTAKPTAKPIARRAVTRYRGPVATLDRIARAFRREIDRTRVSVPRRPADGVQTLLAALVTKPFVILTGLSGSGKTQRALRLGEWFGPDRSCVVAVRPDWTGPDALFGYEDALHPPRWVVPEVLEFILAAAQNPDWPHLLVLDEMNLAHVERYFSDFLSGIESRQPVIPDLGYDDEARCWRPRDVQLGRLPLPRNLFVIGTVNVDETTYLFSPKVLDRATTFELRTTTAELDPRRRMPSQARQAAQDLLAGLVAIVTNDDWHLRNPSPDLVQLDRWLRTLHELLSLTSDEFGHRSYRESLRLAAALEAAGSSGGDAAIDQITLLKILPRIHGARARVEPLLLSLLAFARDPDRDVETLRAEQREQTRWRLPLTADKVGRMLTAVRLNQFVSFTE
ncbi:DUF3578 domain-containing protein [Conexibacter sp. JD483]|uniref:MrcB family domain-containing protein n=1 Tax=unclassified Conexibacter TaxID=2627773 RepID=UPI002724052E|nr:MULTISPECIES: DUF3578 domain-containing protein [unclassified Conexibacter]MDO8188958.1 DUF3578 domain-containing protein [Conexibacter sp. CPCC 205706]MDO8201766.1 DUF3578 domain-containing protein [Conexibacter sp. CPCC 205762]MDR9371431.1 DUF3578 domain-containing protein [Conexibacter sp. JD483]